MSLHKIITKKLPTMTYIDFAIILTSVMAIFMSQSKAYHKYSSLFGLMGQPFWIYTTYNNRQVGMLVISVLYTIGWGYGFWKAWIKDEEVI